MEKTPIDIDDLITEAQDAMFAGDYVQCTALCRQAVQQHRDEFSLHELLIQSLLAQHRDEEALAAAAEWCAVQPRSVVRQTAWNMARPRQWRLQAHAAYRMSAEETLSAVLDQQLVLLQDLTNVELTATEVRATEAESVSDDAGAEQSELDEHDLAAQSRDVQWQGTTAVLDAVTTAALWFDLQAMRARDEATCEEDAELCATIRALIAQWCARRGELSATDSALVALLLDWCHVRAAVNTGNVNHAPFTELMTREVPNEIKIYALALSFVLEFDAHKPHLASDRQSEALHKVTQHFNHLTQILHGTNDPKIQSDVDSSLLYRTITLLLKFLDPKERDQVKNELAHIRRRPGLSLILLGRVAAVLTSSPK